MDQARVIEDGLACDTGEAGRWRWRVCASAAPALTVAAAAAITALNDRDEAPGAAMLKRLPHKQIIRFTDPQGNVFIGKYFIINRWAQRLRYRRYAADEAANGLFAAAHGVHVPSVLALGVEPWLVSTLGARSAVVVTEYLTGYHSLLSELHAAVDLNAQVALLRSVVGVFDCVYRVGCRHLDLNAGNIMLGMGGVESGERPWSVIDWQHAVFFERPSEEALIFMAGHFARALEGFIGVRGESAAEIDAVWNDWLYTLLARTGLDGGPKGRGYSGESPGVTGDWHNRFDYYRRTIISRKRRRKIGP